MVINGFNGGSTPALGVLPVELTVGTRVALTAFFLVLVDAQSTYYALLDRDWIHSNWCVPS